MVFVHEGRKNMKILVLNGPNLNMLGIREPDVYGKETYQSLIDKIERYANEKGVEVICKQSNHEGVLVDEIQAAYGEMQGIVINPGAYTHTSIALLDALKAVGIPTVEVHISAVEKREEFSQISYIRAACIASISGRGTDGYLEAIKLLQADLIAQKQVGDTLV
jgi:3-dehydroquinate dehydratase-2